MFKNWFKNKNTEVADLESVDIEPSIVLPEKTRRELYDLAVIEVQKRRVSELIHRSLLEMIGADVDEYRDSEGAVREVQFRHGKEYSPGIHVLGVSESVAKDILGKYPNALHSTSDCMTVRFKHNPITIEDLLPELTKAYFKESKCQQD